MLQYFIHAMVLRLDQLKWIKWPKASISFLFCTIYAHYAYLINYAWPTATAICWETFKTIRLCNAKLIWHSKLEKMAKTSFFALFCTIYAHHAYLIDYAWPITTATFWETLCPPEYAIPSCFEPPNSRKWSKISFLHFFAQFMHLVRT